MKLKTFFRLHFSLLVMAVSAVEVHACGPYKTIIPTPEFFCSTSEHKSMGDYEREENLRLWQSLTSERIPLEDIEEAVYHDSYMTFQRKSVWERGVFNNKFYNYICNTRDEEIICLLTYAKQIEECWKSMTSPWYYPEERYPNGPFGDFGDIIDELKRYDGKRLRDRYALQISRAYFASRCYSGCIEYVDSAFADIPDDNLMKRMALRYKAGSWARLGYKDKADTIFAKTGDVWSLSCDNSVEMMSRLNPNAPQLMDYIRHRIKPLSYGCIDTVFIQSLEPVAKTMVKDRRVKHKGDWHFLLAYYHNDFAGNTSVARSEIYKALAQPFSTEELSDLARAYKMKLDAKTGHTENLLADLRWMESKIDVLEEDAYEWSRRCRNIVYEHWVPQLWKKRDYATAILLCAYADNIALSYDRNTIWTYNEDSSCYSPFKCVTAAEMRQSEVYYNTLDYWTLSFQLMGSLSSNELAASYNKIQTGRPLYKFLRRKARTDKDYYYELIGTLALREENYSRAEKYLSQVSRHYMKTLNLDKEGLFSRDAFNTYISRWDKCNDWEFEHEAAKHGCHSCPDAKLNFARKMLSYRRQMKHGKTADDRGMARLMYAIGRRNSFEECWALTQYWRGTGVRIFYPALLYEWDDTFATQEYGFLYDYEQTVGHETTEKLYKEEIAKALAMLQSDEAKAKANYILGNLKTIVKRYGNTPTAQFVKSSCDNWRSWL